MAKRTCSVDGCGRPHVGRGYCKMHYSRWRKTGQLGLLRQGTPEVRFWRMVDKRGPIPDYAPHLGSCWIWKGTRDAKGYGHFDHGIAHRFAYVLANGPVPDDRELDHLCRVRACVNPLHLEAVTHQENVLRAITGIQRDAEGNQTHCRNGHLYTEASLYIHPKRGTRDCRLCGVESRRRSQNGIVSS